MVKKQTTHRKIIDGVLCSRDQKSQIWERDIDVIYKNKIRRIGMNVTYTIQVCIMELEGL